MAAGTDQNQQLSDFPSAASIRRRYGTGVPGYEAAKAAWLLANPNPSPDEYTAAMRRIARAVSV